MDTVGSSEHVAEVSKVSKFTLNEHKLYVLKHATQIVHDKELVGGAFEKIPTRQPSIPPYTVRTKLTETHDAYELMRRDTSGDTKVTRIGELLGGRCYLFNTFRLPGKTKNLYVLVDDLLEVLGFDINVDQFLQRYEQLYPIVATEEEKSFLQEAGLHMGKKDCAVYVTALSTFVLFGAAVVAAGCRVIDDYWEQLVKEQGFTMHHRVFPLSQFQLSLLSQLKPVPLLDEKVNTLEQKQVDWLQKWEAPYLTIQEQQSTEVRQEYGKEHARGEHTSTIVPGQSINCSLELSMNYDVPKYHYKNSFVNAQQNNVEDVPIGRHKQVETIPNGPVGRPSKRSDDDKDVISERDHSLNINGWKFDCLPLAPKGTNLGRTSRGLPYFEKERLLHRLRRLTPNQVRELEHAHDSLNLNTGLGKVRQVRRTKWLKYWQYKSGAPIGMTADQVEEFRTQYLSAILNYVEKETVYDEERNINIIHSTSRHPNSNFIGHSNVSGLKPPYIENPAYK